MPRADRIGQRTGDEGGSRKCTVASHDHLSRILSTQRRDRAEWEREQRGGRSCTPGRMKIAEEAHDHLSKRNEVPSVGFWSCWKARRCSNLHPRAGVSSLRRQKKGNRKEEIGEWTCGRHVSWKRTTRMMNLSRGQPRCNGRIIVLSWRVRAFTFENIFHREFPAPESTPERTDPLRRR